jgi:hypothetical protein
MTNKKRVSYFYHPSCVRQKGLDWNLVQLKQRFQIVFFLTLIFSAAASLLLWAVTSNEAASA